jgi:hypothetical protein
LCKFWIPSLVNCASSINIIKTRKLGFVPRKKTGRTLLSQGNLAVTRPVHAADGRSTAVDLATLSRQLNE